VPLLLATFLLLTPADVRSLNDGPQVDVTCLHSVKPNTPLCLQVSPHTTSDVGHTQVVR